MITDSDIMDSDLRFIRNALQTQKELLETPGAEDPSVREVVRKVSVSSILLTCRPHAKSPNQANEHGRPTQNYTHGGHPGALQRSYGTAYR